MIQTVKNGTDKRFLPLVSFQQYVLYQCRVKTLKTQNTVI